MFGLIGWGPDDSAAFLDKFAAPSYRLFVSVLPIPAAGRGVVFGRYFRGGAGFLLVEAEHPQELTAFLQPYMDLMSVDVHAVYQLNYDQMINELRKVAHAGTPA